MNQSHDFLPTCKEDAFTQAVIKACGHGPVAQGWINDPADCHWSPYKLVGLTTPCGTITRADAAVMTKIWDGPVSVQGKKLWYGLERGASLAGRVAGLFAPEPRQQPSAFPELSDREREVLDLLAAGRSTDAIARELFVSNKTVRNAVSSIYGKLHAEGRADAIIKAREAGFGRDA